MGYNKTSEPTYTSSEYIITLKRVGKKRINLSNTGNNIWLQWKTKDKRTLKKLWIVVSFFRGMSQYSEIIFCYFRIEQVSK